MTQETLLALVRKMLNERHRQAYRVDTHSNPALKGWVAIYGPNVGAKVLDAYGPDDTEEDINAGLDSWS